MTDRPNRTRLGPPGISAGGPAASSSGRPAAGSPRWGWSDLLTRGGFFSGRAGAAETARRPGNPLAPKPPHFAPKAKSVIFLFMYGGPSHVDTFDYKPTLYELDGKTIPVKTFGRGGKKNEGRVVGPKWKFKQYGQCGKWVSDLFPHLATCVDDIAFLHSMTADSPIHGSAMLQMNTGKILSGSPCLGSWVNYGLGSENENLPGFVVMLDPTGGPISGAKNWSSGYMPAPVSGDPAAVRRRAGARPEAARRAERGRPAAAARHAARLQHRSPGRSRGQQQPRRPDRQLRDGLRHAAARARGGRPDPGDGRNPGTVRPGRRPDARIRPPLPAGPPHWSSAACGSSSSTRAAPTTTATGTPTATWRRTTTSTPDAPTSRSPGCSRTSNGAGCSTRRWSSGAASSAASRPPSTPKGTGRDHNAYGFTMWMAGGGIKGGVSVGADRRDRLGRGRGPLPRQAPARHDPAPAGPRPQRLDLLLRRPRSEARRRRRGRADSADPRVIGSICFVTSIQKGRRPDLVDRVRPTPFVFPVHGSRGFQLTPAIP